MFMTAALIGPAHGLRGEVILDIRSDDPELFLIGTQFATSSQETPSLTLRSLRQHKDRVVAQFEEVSGREGAEGLRGVRLLTDERTEEDAWYPHQLKGLQAIDLEGRPLGTIKGIQMGTAQDLLLVKAESGVVMVPFVHQLVPQVDVEGGTVTIEPLPGLFDDQAVEAR